MPPGQQEVPKLVHEHEHAEHERESEQRLHQCLRPSSILPPGPWPRRARRAQASTAWTAASVSTGAAVWRSMASAMTSEIAVKREASRPGTTPPRPRWRRSARSAGCDRPRARETPAAGTGSRPTPARGTPACRRAPGPGSRTDVAHRSGYEKAYWIGSRMSVRPICASIDPSANSTSEWTIDCGCTIDLDLRRRQAEQPVRLDHLEALVHQRGRVDGDLRPHLPRRMPQRVVAA